MNLFMYTHENYIIWITIRFPFSLCSPIIREIPGKTINKNEYHTFYQRCIDYRYVVWCEPVITTRLRNKSCVQNNRKNGQIIEQA